MFSQRKSALISYLLDLCLYTIIHAGNLEGEVKLREFDNPLYGTGAMTKDPSTDVDESE